MSRAPISLICSLVLFLSLVSHAEAQQWKTLIGFDDLVTEFGGALETGSGVVVSQVEAPNSDGNYLPDTIPPTASQFSGKTFVAGSGASGISGHSRLVAVDFYGNTGSVAPGVTDITVFEAQDWLDNVLNTVSGMDPDAQNFQLQNHSWIGNGFSVADAEDILQRLDFTINQSGMLAVVGVNNGTNATLPQILAQGYNSISVGVTDGSHSATPTTLYGAGRTKPEIVAPGFLSNPNSTTTSRATANVSSASALLLEAGAGTDATQVETMKAILMAGANKTTVANWDRTTTRPLDERFGAGELSVYNSYKILKAGEVDGLSGGTGASIGEMGWDYNDEITSTDPVYYELDLSGETGEIKELSIMLNWNIDVTDTDGSIFFNATTSLANLDLRLYNSTAGFLDTLVDSSLSTVDNLEHIYLTDLLPGIYTIEVTTDTDHDYGLAWRTEIIPEPGHYALIGILVVGLFFRIRRRGKSETETASR